MFTAKITVARWQLNVFGLVCISIGIILGGYLAIDNLLGTKAATSPWTQTDWSGGVGASTTNQYSAGTNVDATTTAGQVTVSPTSGWYDTNWKYRQSIGLTNSGSTLTNFQVQVTLDTAALAAAGKLLSNCNDLRFTNSTGTLLSHWIQQNNPGCDNAATKIWVKVDSLPNGSSTIYVYYGNSGAASTDSGANTFTFFDDFSGASIDPTKWTTGGTVDASGGEARIQTTTSRLYATNAIGSQWVGEYRLKLYDHVTPQDWIGVRWYNHATYGSNRAFIWWFYGSDARYSYDLTNNAYTSTGALSYSLDTNYHSIKTVVNGTTQSLYDGATLINSADYSGQSCTGSCTYSPAFGRWAAYSTNYFQIDYVAVRQYTATEPTVGAPSAEESRYNTSGTLTSNIFDTEFSSDWGTLTYSADTTGGTVSVKVRAGNQADLSDATAFGSCSAVGSGADLSGGCTSDQKRYVQYQVALTSVSAGTPIFQDASIAFAPSDITAPVNPTSVTAKNQSDGAVSLTSGTWYNYPAPSFTLLGAADNAGPEGNASGLQGYFVYFGTDPTANPQTAGAFQAGTAYTAASLTSGNTYYLRVKTRDVAQNVTAAATTLFTYQYDATPPVNPTYVAANPAGYSAANAFSFIWPAGSDTLSGLSGYYYKTGATSGAYSADQYTTATILDGLPAYQTGANIFYLRTADVAGNTNSSYIQVTYYYNPDAPSAPQNLTVTPASNTRNSFAFTWSAPATFKGQIAGYRYSINAKPTATNTTLTTGTSLAAGAYATQIGENTFYVVAVDDSGNVNYDAPASVTFTAQTAAPAVPISVSITDASNRTAALYALTISWKAPDLLPEDFSGYIIERSETASTAAGVRAQADLTYVQVAKVTDTAYTNTGLDPAKTYYYRVKTVDTTANASVPSSIVSKIPTGKFVDPPAITKGPAVEGKSTTAVITWSTDRVSTSLAQYGTSTSYGSSAGELKTVTDHALTLTGLTPSTTYHLRVQSIDAPEFVDYSTTDKGFSPDIAFRTLDAPGLTDINISDITLTSAIVSWKSNVVATSKVLYGTSTGYGLEVTDASSSQVTNHAVRLAKLQHSTSYHIRIDSKDAEGNSLRSDDYVFDTLKMPVASNVQFQPVKGKPTATIDVSWKTNVPTTSVVSYRPETETAPLEQSKAALETDHAVQVTNLLDDTSYVLSITGRDGYGNAVLSDVQRFKTDTDSRAPQITDIVIETQTQGRGEEAKAQLVVSWNTDEPTSAQVEYGPGLSGDYPNRTAEEAVYSNSHVVVVSELDPAKTYHLHVKSKDRAGNETLSGDQVVITGKASTSVLNLILNNLQRTFGWLGGLGG